MPSGSSGGWLERDVVSEGLELGDEALGVAFGVAALEVVAAEAEAGLEALVLGGEVAAFAADRSEGGLFEREAEPLGALARAPGAAFAGGLVVAGAASGPAGEVAGGREHAHVGADLSDHDFGGAPGGRRSSCWRVALRRPR